MRSTGLPTLPVSRSKQRRRKRAPIFARHSASINSMSALAFADDYATGASNSDSSAHSSRRLGAPELVAGAFCQISGGGHMEPRVRFVEVPAELAAAGISLAGVGAAHDTRNGPEIAGFCVAVPTAKSH